MQGKCWDNSQIICKYKHTEHKEYIYCTKFQHKLWTLYSKAT